MRYHTGPTMSANSCALEVLTITSLRMTTAKRSSRSILGRAWEIVPVVYEQKSLLLQKMPLDTPLRHSSGKPSTTSTMLERENLEAAEHATATFSPLSRHSIAVGEVTKYGWRQVHPTPAA